VHFLDLVAVAEVAVEVAAAGVEEVVEEAPAILQSPLMSSFNRL